jgi:dihydrofolate reductase
MGRKTFESLGKPLPKRTNIIISRNPDYAAEGCVVVNSLQAALEAAKDDLNPYILGGAEIYRQGMEFADKLDITLVHSHFEADVFFPEIDGDLWQEISRETHKADDHNKYDYSFVQYIRRQQ